MLRLLGWNAFLLVMGVVLAVIAGEAYLRLTKPFAGSSDFLEFVPNVGLLWMPHTEIPPPSRIHGYWSVPRTNSLGFLDREPLSPERAAATCHVSIIGDSFVMARRVPIHDKFHVLLEELAPYLNVTTSAFGMGGTGQVQQLPFYDEYARRLHPKLLVLVFVRNDFVDNAPVLRKLTLRGRHRKSSPEPMVRRRSDGKLELAWSRTQDQLPWSPRSRPSWTSRAMDKAADHSAAVLWLRNKKKALAGFFGREDEFTRNVQTLRRQPGYATLFEGWTPSNREDMGEIFDRREMPPLFEDALQYTAFALEQFRERADRDGVKLVILASYTLRVHGAPMFERLSRMAATLGIPIIDQADYILRQGAELRDARWPRDFHWNPAGHRWAAEALLEYIKEHPAICGGPTGAAALLEPTP